MTLSYSLPPAIASYLERMSRELKPLPTTERDDVLREIRAHLEDGLAAGQAPDALLTGLGPVEEVAQALLNERLVTVDRQRSPGQLIALMLKAAGLPFVLAMLGFTALMEFNTLYLYAEMCRSLEQTMRLILLSLPPILTVALPVAILAIGLTGLPRLASVLSGPTMKRLYPKVAAAMLLVGVLAAIGGFYWNDRVVSWANQQTIDMVSEILHKPKSGVDARSAQEYTLAELDGVIAKGAAEKEARAKAGASAAELSTLDSRLRQMWTARHLKMSLPGYCIPLAALGLAFGSLLARRRSVPLWLQLGLIVATIASLYTVMSLGMTAAESFITPFMGAWLPLLLPLGLAGLLWAFALIGKKGVFADV